jgi:hypothetical protein
MQLVQNPETISQKLEVLQGKLLYSLKEAKYLLYYTFMTLSLCLYNSQFRKAKMCR